MEDISNRYENLDYANSITFPKTLDYPILGKRHYSYSEQFMRKKMKKKKTCEEGRQNESHLRQKYEFRKRKKERKEIVLVEKEGRIVKHYKKCVGSKKCVYMIIVLRKCLQM